MSQNKMITKRIYAKGTLILESPLILGSGRDDLSDNDALRDWGGQLFLPGTSLAGVIRDCIETNYSKYADELFGKKGADSTICKISIYDAHPVTTIITSIRDGVALDQETKTAIDRSKYDYEIIEPKAEFEFRMETVVRVGETLVEEGVKTILFELSEGNINLGAKTTRGFGKIKLNKETINFVSLDLTKEEDIKSWINWNWTIMNNKFDFKPVCPSSKEEIVIDQEFQIPYSLMIRHYETDPSGLDMAQLAYADKTPIIPGTSWTGVLRHGAYAILEELGVANPNNLLDKLFGFVKKDTKQAARSRIIVNESLIKDSLSMNTFRNKIDRFTGGTVNSALFEEAPVYGGTVKLEIKIRQANNEASWERALIQMVLQDMADGILPVGGETAIGRGILHADRKKLVISAKDQKALITKINEVKNEVEDNED